MSKFFATLIDEVQSDLGGDTTTYTDAIVTIQLEKAIKKVSESNPYEMMETFKIESRTGTADEDIGDALVDDAQTQFVSTAFDVGREIYNTTDKTRAVVTAFIDTGELTLSSDIFPDGDEGYAIFNKGCRNKYQINIGEVTDYIGNNHGVFAVEHPLGERRNFTIGGDILTIDIDKVDDSSESDADVEVFVWFDKLQRVTQLVEPAGNVSGTVLAGATTFAIVSVGTGSETIVRDTLFTVAGVRGTYRIKYDVELSGGAGTIVFWPGLESAPTTGVAVAFLSTDYGSTLTSELERLVVELAAAYSALSIQANAIPKGGAGTYGRYETKLGLALNELERMRPRRTKRSYPRD